MISRILCLLLVCSMIATGQKLPHSEYEHYEGYYVIDFKQGDPFENFAQFELHVSQLKDSSLQMEGKIIFFTDTIQTRVDTECTTTFRKFFITKDSLYFQSQQCFGESYEFAGRFLGVPSEFEGKEDDPVLEGNIVFKKNQKLIKQATVRFLWSVGC